VTPFVVADGVGVGFWFDRQRRVMTPFAARIRRHASHTWGLRGVDFRIDGGAGVALIGATGSGKTTLLRTLAGVLATDEGRIVVNGRIGSLLSTNGGLMTSLTGRENTLLIGTLAGLSRPQARAAIDLVQQRSKLVESFERPVSSYSQGMRARLGFSIIEVTEPEILLLDEVHEALDDEFRGLLEERVRAVVARGGIVVAAGHDHALLGRICERALLLQDGGLVADGGFADVRRAYVDSPRT
jgi:ABC-type polysaccharide/polyol phosphate transport system ATPase subunit